MAEEKAKTKEETRIMRCTCQHEFQDETYGKGMRVHNVSKSGRAVCTVCVPNYRTNRMDPATDTPPNAMLRHGYIMGRKNRNIKQVA